MPAPAPSIATITDDPALGREQHWVSNSYLRAWRDPSTPQGAYFWVSPKDQSSPPIMQSPKRTFVLADAYTMRKDNLRNLGLENMYHRFETQFGSLKARMTRGEMLTDDDHETIVAFVAAHLIRTPKFRSKLRFQEMGDHREELASIDDPVLRNGVEKTLSYIVVNEYQIISFHTFTKAMEMIGALRMTLLLADDSQYFITSDAPCCVIQCRDEEASLFEALASPTSNVLMPLSSKVLAVFDHSNRPHEMIALCPNQPRVHEMNAIIWRGADQKIVLPHSTIEGEWFADQIDNKLAGFVVL